MTEYLVIIPIAGSMSKIIEAENETDAIEAAMDEDWPIEMKTKNGWELDEIDRYEKIVEGNVLYVDVSEASAEEYE